LEKLTSATSIVSATLYIKNKHFYYSSGGTGYFATHAYQGKTKPTATTNAFTSSFSYGQGKTITLPAGVLTGLKAGTVKGFSLGVSAPDNISQYSYFYGASYSSRPYITVTYT
jgi:hypothetical protein